MSLPRGLVIEKESIEYAGDDVLVLDCETLACHAFKPNAYRVWRACDGTRSVSDAR